LNAKYFDCVLACASIAALFAFWLYNRPPARIFMGDSGSLLIGFIIASCAIRACSMPIKDDIINPVFVLCILAYPSVDTLRVFILRIMSKKSPFSADRNHIHHILIDKKFNHGWASFFAVMYCFTLTLICFFVIEYHYISFFIMVFLAILFIVLPIASFLRRIVDKIICIFKK
jgi:UDP-N-acetylmuramyl pentapeptide phosphotransferase/UDP-N-acetylglucosamine-1-phosphate transferase